MSDEEEKKKDEGGDILGIDLNATDFKRMRAHILSPDFKFFLNKVVKARKMECAVYGMEEDSVHIEFVRGRYSELDDFTDLLEL